MPDSPVATTTVAAPAAATTPAAPTAEQLAAAIAGTTTPTETPSGGYRYEIAPNVVFEGATPEEAIDKMVAGLKKREEFIGTLKSENQQLRASTQPRDESGRFAPQQQPAAATDKFDQQKYFNLLTEDPMSAANYLDGYRFGIPAEQVVPTFNRTVQTSTMAADNLLVTSFFTECPDFPHGDDAAMKALVDTVDQMGGVYTPMSMKAAHRLCIDANKYTPVQTIGAPETTTTRPVPLPVPNQSSASEPASNWMQMAEGMTADQLRAAIAKLEASGVK